MNNSSITGTPAAAPSGRAGVQMAASGVTRHRVYGYGDHEDVVNPGDLLIHTIIGDGTTPVAQLAIMIRGKDIRGFVVAAQNALAQYEANRDWLSQPVTRFRDNGDAA